MFCGTATNMKMNGISTALTFTLAATLSAAEAPVSWLPGETVQQRDTRMAWWREAKFGMFIHWGIYSIPADGEWHMRKHQKPFAEYSKYAAQFDPVKFNADEWMSLAHGAGMKYVVITTKHHDGFAMFKSGASAYNIVDATPYKRDVIKELAAACPKHDIRFGIYYSFLADWGHKGGGAGCPLWDPGFQDGDLHEYVNTVALPQLKELLSNYGPISVVWFDSDGSQGIKPEESAQVIELLKSQPQVIVDPRLPGVKGDFATAEQHMPELRPEGDWELCGTVNGTWGYTRNAAKPLNKLLPYMITAWGMGGNVLMNVGPSPEGIIPADSAQRLRDVGEWLKIYGESIYGTTGGAVYVSALGHRHPQRRHIISACLRLARRWHIKGAAAQRGEAGDAAGSPSARAGSDQPPKRPAAGALACQGSPCRGQRGGADARGRTENRLPLRAVEQTGQSFVGAENRRQRRRCRQRQPLAQRPADRLAGSRCRQTSDGGHAAVVARLLHSQELCARIQSRE